MKPFNLEAALNGAKVVTRDGVLVKDLKKIPDMTFELEGCIYERTETWTSKGRYYGYETNSCNDLFMAD